ncbi:protein FRIGIDA isoform X1 [Capsicum chacoense]
MCNLSSHKQEMVNASLQTHPHDSIANLRALSDSLSAFQGCFTELHQHIDSIRSAIHSVLPLLTTNNTPLPASSPPPTTVSPVLEPEQSWESDPSEEEEVQSPHRKDVQSHNSEEFQCPAREEVQFHRSEEVQRPLCSMLEYICKSGAGRGLRRYMAKRISDVNILLEEVPKALRLACNPARLVLECMGKFYEQKSKAFPKDLSKASILGLECFLLMGIDKSVNIEKRVKDEADKAALAWRKRLITEGGIRNAIKMDAQGLLLLIGCFGIPGGFANEDIRDLLQKCRIKHIKGALRRSNVLMAKTPEIIEGMVKQNMEVDSVHVAYTFGIEDRFNPQRLLTSFLLDSEESLKKMKENKDSLAAMDEAKRKHLFALTSVSKCLKLHDIEASKLLPGWKIDEKIMALENEIGGFDKQTGRQMAQKRKNDETGSSRWSRNREAKRSRFLPWLRQQSVNDHVNINNTLVKGRTTGHRHGHTVFSSVLHGPAAGSIHENVAGSLAGTVRGVAMGGTGSGISASANGIHAGIAAGTDVVQQGGSYAGGHGGTLVDSTPGQIGSHAGQLYGRRGDAAVYDRPASSNYAYRPSSYLEGSNGLQNSQLSAASRPPYLEGSAGVPNTTHSDAYRPSPYLEGSTGLPNTTHSNAYRPPPYSEGSSQLPNAIPGYSAGQSSASGHPSSHLYRPR